MNPLKKEYIIEIPKRFKKSLLKRFDLRIILAGNSSEVVCPLCSYYTDDCQRKNKRCPLAKFALGMGDGCVEWMKELGIPLRLLWLDMDDVSLRIACHRADGSISLVVKKKLKEVKKYALRHIKWV